MSEATTDIKALNEKQGLNKYTLLKTETEEVNNQYKEFLENIEGSLTTVSDNDASSKFKVAINNLDPTPTQANTLSKFQHSFREIENQIDPERLKFEISKAADDDIIIHRRSENGITTLIINDDGSAAFSFIAYKHSEKADSFIYLGDGGDLDCEKLAFNFFSL